MHRGVPADRMIKDENMTETREQLQEKYVRLTANA